MVVKGGVVVMWVVGGSGGNVGGEGGSGGNVGGEGGSGVMWVVKGGVW